MPSLISDTGEIINDQHSILHETKEFYKKLYAEKPVEDIDLKYKLRNLNVPVLSNEKQNLLEGAISYEELLMALKNAKNNKSPGSDGFTVEF